VSIAWYVKRGRATMMSGSRLTTTCCSKTSSTQRRSSLVGRVKVQSRAVIIRPKALPSLDMHNVVRAFSHPNNQTVYPFGWPTHWGINRFRHDREISLHDTAHHPPRQAAQLKPLSSVKSNALEGHI
jgi:hypothetical protein